MGKTRATQRINDLSVNLTKASKGKNFMTVDSKRVKSGQVGDHAPDFTLPNQSGEIVRLGDYLGESNIVLEFYPKDETSGCTSQACRFRDSYNVVNDPRAVVYGDR